MLKIDAKKLELSQAKKGINTNQIILKSGLTEKTIQNIKNGKPCRPLSVHKLAKALDVDVTEILKE
ncbi:helix-turn-helix domain-containing protein [Bulleidia sp. HCP3S3_F2]|uniref:helix-turn-helix domain-containing protein n=1 Tax=unclassified Bulleidia TaxID=2704656 RepID=UPI003F8A6B00